MLDRLYIQNYAIIDELTISFPAGLNIITGETGAGKSILMGALSLILGDRADTSVLMNRTKKLVVEGVFKTGDRKEITRLLLENELDVEEELFIRREVSASGKSRAFVNDTPVNLEQLRNLCALLVDLHQQFDTLALGEMDFQRQVLDALAAHTSLLQEYQHNYRQWVQQRQQLAQMQLEKEQSTREYDYNRFLHDELEAFAVQENELEDMEKELKLLGNSEEIKHTLNRVAYGLTEGETPFIVLLKQWTNQFRDFSDTHAGMAMLAERLNSVQIELQDIAEETAKLEDQINFDPEKLQIAEERLSAGYKLFKKHGVKDSAGLLLLQKELNQKLQDVFTMDEAIVKLEKAVAELKKQLDKLAVKLSDNRKKEISPLEKKVNQLLHQVGMPNARLKVNLQQVELNRYGQDAIEFLFDANNNGKPEPVRKVASGGELSRLMLCIKSLVARSLDLPVMIFDEIDTGISGEAALQVGKILKDIAQNRQVICITHQPQIAGKANAHFFVYKETKGNNIRTGIRLLNESDRILAIAQMLGGANPSAAALENAREMIVAGSV